MALSLGLGIGLTRAKGGGFNFADWRAAQADGIWIDYTDPDWLRQEPNGPTAVAATNDVIGLALSRRLAGQGGTLAAYLATQPELVIDSSFNSAGAWSPATGWSITGGRAVASSVGAFLSIQQAFSPVPGRLYRLEIVVSEVTSGAVRLRFLGGSEPAVTNRTAPGTYVEYIVGANNSTIALQAGASGFTGAVDSISVKEVSRAAAAQAVINQRPRFDGLNGAIHDALDDNLLSNYTLKSGVNMLIARVSVPGAMSAYNIALGNQGAGGGRFRLAIANTNGRFEAGVGSDTALFGDSVDLRGQTVNIGVACNGTIVRMFRGDAQVLEVAQSGAVDTAVPLCFGAQNGNGTASSFWSGRIFKAGAFHLSAMPDETLWRNISASL